VIFSQDTPKLGKRARKPPSVYTEAASPPPKARKKARVRKQAAGAVELRVPPSLPELAGEAARAIESLASNRGLDGSNKQSVERHMKKLHAAAELGKQAVEGLLKVEARLRKCV
jgi:hypothetical protein